ncbi:MAG: hypothetical protein Q9166_006330 [cf. Caloplaca sp. 2 TL-2023]
MARRKSRTPRFRFPIAQLPSEVLHLIFAAANRKDILKLRLTCKTLAAIGLDYLIPEVELLFTRRSFDRVKGIAEHPVCGQRVTSLVYRVDSLRQHFDKDEYLDALTSLLSMDDFVGPPASASERERRLDKRNRARATNPYVKYNKRQLALGWTAYNKLWFEQQQLRDKSYGEEEIIRIVDQLPNLKHISLFNFQNYDDKGSYYDRTYSETLLRALGDEGYDEPCGVPQLLSVSRALNLAKTAIESLKAALVSWRILEASGEDFEQLKCVFTRLKTLKIWFVISQRYGWQHPEDDGFDMSTEQDDECQYLLNQGQHIELFRSLTNVHSLYICFHSVETSSFDMKSIFGGLQWPRLRELSLNLLSSTSEDLLNLLTMHAATLRILKIWNYTLTVGLWLYTLRAMRESLNLEDIEFRAFLSSDEYPSKDRWDLVAWNEEDKAFPVRDKFRAYVLESNEITLEGIINHGEHCSCRGGPYNDMHGLI